MKGLLFVLLLIPFSLQATLIELADCTLAEACVITDTPPEEVFQDPNDGVLLAWDELQNFTLESDLRVDRVFDPNADFVVALPGGDFLIKAGTIVSSHYLQWDSLGDNNPIGSVSATIKLDSQVFAFITADQNLFDSDYLGVEGLNYSDFTLRGLEAGDTTVFNNTDVDINWAASTPGDWTRLITAFSPAAVKISEPVNSLLTTMLLVMTLARKRA